MGPKVAMSPKESGPASGTGPLDFRIADALMRDIVHWRIEPGAWIKERQVTERFNCSHGPVREAFRHLAREGFVELVPWRGARVHQLDRHAVQDVCDLWRSLFGTACAMAARRLTPEEGQTLDGLMRAYETKVREGVSTAEQVRVSWPIGIFIASHTGCPLAEELLTRVARIVRWQHHILENEEVERRQPEIGQTWVRLYRLVIDAIIANRPEEAERNAREFLGFSQLQLSLAMTTDRSGIGAGDDRVRSDLSSGSA